MPTEEDINKPSELESKAGGLGGLVGGKPVKTVAKVCDCCGLLREW